jgi:hypothetical protein
MEIALNILQDPHGLQFGHGATVWDNALILSKYTTEAGRIHFKPGARVLELGCGCGLDSNPFDVILGADIMYDSCLAGPLSSVYGIL